MHKMSGDSGVSIAWLKWSMFCFVIAEESSEEFVMEVLSRVGCERVSRMATSTLWSAVRCSPIA